MNTKELTKSQKRIARQIIETGLQREYTAGIEKLKVIIDRWKNKELNNRDAYIKIYKSLTNHDKHIGWRYDRITGSRYLQIIASQLADNVISIDELDEFPDEIIQRIKLLSEF